MTRRPWSAVYTLIFLNVTIWLVNAFFFLPSASSPQLNHHDLNNVMALHATDIFHPTLYYRFITAGFAHADAPMHILGNMICLFMFGTPLEQRYGKREFLAFYLTAIVVAGLFWCLSMNLSPPMDEYGQPVNLDRSSCIGASGGVMALLFLFAINYPNAKLLFFFIIPMPAWLAGVALMYLDIVGEYAGGTGIAHSAHIGGAVFGLVYYLLRRQFIYFFGFLPGGGYVGNRHANRYGLKVFDEEAGRSASRQSEVSHRWTHTSARSPEEIQIEQAYRDIQDEVDRILRKIRLSGRESLTPDEVRTMEDAAKIYSNYRKQ